MAKPCEFPKCGRGKSRCMCEGEPNPVTPDLEAVKAAMDRIERKLNQPMGEYDDAESLALALYDPMLEIVQAVRQLLAHCERPERENSLLRNMRVKPMPDAIVERDPQPARLEGELADLHTIIKNHSLMTMNRLNGKYRPMSAGEFRDELLTTIQNIRGEQ